MVITARKPPAPPDASLSGDAYALCFSSAEEAAEGPSEDEPKPSAVDLATVATTHSPKPALIGSAE